ncbi:MAG: cytochrome bd-I oxidase subunit CydX [Brevundimonas sp.]|nr:MAG: cytochrome bd-I oxidase subunit CydX [Brevundimonas sp.]
MWYFAWILGLGLAVAFGVLNGLWHEFALFDEGDAGLSTPDASKEDDVPL